MSMFHTAMSREEFALLVMGAKDEPLFGALMWEIGVEGDRFRPHVFNLECKTAGCQPVGNIEQRSHISDFDRANVWRAMNGGTNFGANLLRLIAKADIANREALRLVYPDYVAAYEAKVRDDGSLAGVTERTEDEE